MKNFTALLFGLIVGTILMLSLGACAHTPKPGERGYTVHETYTSYNDQWRGR